MERDLGGLQNRVARQIMVRRPRGIQDGSWYYPPLLEVMREAGLEEIEWVIHKSQNTVAYFILTRLIWYLCEGVVRSTGTQVSKRLW